MSLMSCQSASPDAHLTLTCHPLVLSVSVDGYQSEEFILILVLFTPLKHSVVGEYLFELLFSYSTFELDECVGGISAGFYGAGVRLVYLVSQ